MCMVIVCGLLALFELSLQFSQCVEVAKRGAGSNVLDGGSGFLLRSSLAGSGLLHVVLTLFESTAVREDDTLGLLHELNHLELELLTRLSLCAIGLHEVLRSGKALTALVERDHGTLVHHLGNLTSVDAARSVESLVGIPRIVLKLLVAKAQTTVLLVDFEHDNVDVGTLLSELRGMLHLLRPREVADVDKTVNTLFELNEGGEGFATPKHLVKADGTQAQQGEELEFKVIEFVKETKRIILSHSRTFEEAKDEEKKVAARKAAPKKDATPAIQNVAASTTLGDLDALAELKAKLEKGE